VFPALPCVSVDSSESSGDSVNGLSQSTHSFHSALGREAGDDGSRNEAALNGDADVSPDAPPPIIPAGVPDKTHHASPPSPPPPAPPPATQPRPAAPKPQALHPSPHRSCGTVRVVMVMGFTGFSVVMDKIKIRKTVNTAIKQSMGVSSSVGKSGRLLVQSPGSA